MHCFIREITPIFDHLDFLILLFLASIYVVYNLRTTGLVAELRRSKGNAYNDGYPSFWLPVLDRPTRDELKLVGRPRYFLITNSFTVIFVLLMSWPMYSPTYCEQVKCKGLPGLKPKTECLRSKAKA